MQAKMYFIGRFGKSQEPLQLASCSWLKINWNRIWCHWYGPIKFEILRREYVTLVYAAPSTCRVPVPLSRVQDKHAFYVYKNKNYTVRPYTYQKSKMCNGPML